MIDNAAIAQRAPLREHIDAATAEFIARGGEVQQIGSSKHNILVPFTVSQNSRPAPGGSKIAAEALARARGQAASRRAPKKPRTKRSDPQRDLEALARRMEA